MIEEQCVYVCGAYKGYGGKAEYDGASDLFHGEVVGVRDVVTFQGRTIQEVRQAFRDSVDDYLEFCAERGEKPEKPFSGKFLARIDPEVHRRLSMMAANAGESLNQYIANTLTMLANKGPIATHALPQSPTKKKSEAKKSKAKRKPARRAPTRRGARA